MRVHVVYVCVCVCVRARARVYMYVCASTRASFMHICTCVYGFVKLHRSRWGGGWLSRKFDDQNDFHFQETESREQKE